MNTTATRAAKAAAPKREILTVYKITVKRPGYAQLLETVRAYTMGDAIGKVIKSYPSATYILLDAGLRDAADLVRVRDTWEVVQSSGDSVKVYKLKAAK